MKSTSWIPPISSPRSHMGSDTFSPGWISPLGSGMFRTSGNFKNSSLPVTVLVRVELRDVHWDARIWYTYGYFGSSESRPNVKNLGWVDTTFRDLRELRPTLVNSISMHCTSPHSTFSGKSQKTTCGEKKNHRHVKRQQDLNHLISSLLV